ncbi:hypothetical protein SETIT_5G006700v2 [Setaria italica]|nr:hypothetical protein SETIT_5G006700v2 [Setaria italica]
MGSFSCFHHGDMERRSTLDEGALKKWFENSRARIDEFYDEAARRLPLKEMPELDGCIYAGGLCFGLADPVTNIILNAVGLLLHDQQGEHPPPHGRVRVYEGWRDVVWRSIDGIAAFMNAYFRYLSTDQAKRYLYLASQDLTLAIKLVHHDRFAQGSSNQRRPLLPDGGKLKAALRFAALKAQHPAPDVLAGLMTAEYPRDTLAPVLFKLGNQQGGKEQLTTDDVLEIRDLLAHQWPPTPQPANIDFWCRPNGRTCTRRGDDGVLVISNSLGEDLVAQTSIVTTRDYFQTQQQNYISDLVFCCEDMETKLSRCLEASALAASAMATEVNYDVPPCEHIISVKMCLLDTIHALYIKALATLPSKPSLLRALLVAGHCYGLMDPVSNIILNSFWYDVAFPLARGVEVDLPQGILDTRPMARLESRSLDGLVAMVQGTFGSKHRALEFLSSLDCDLTRSSYLGRPIIKIARNVSFAAVAEIAKHPQHTAFGSFLMSLSPEKIGHLHSLISAAHWDQLIRVLSNEMYSVWPVSVLKEEDSSLVSPFVSARISGKRLAFIRNLDFVHTELNKVLRKYCNQHPWEPSYQLDIICGVTASSSPFHPNFYHANFLATINDAIGSSHERTLFFAEFWVSPSREDVQSKPSSCCPIYDYSACIGRCSFCEDEGNKILHPPSGHSRDFNGSINLYRSAVRAYKDVLKGLLVSDFIYFDPGRDVELAKIIHDYEDNNIPEMLDTKPSLVCERPRFI